MSIKTTRTLEPLFSCISFTKTGMMGGCRSRIEVQEDGEDERLTRTRQASEETGSTGSVRSEAREERISQQDKAEAPSADADKPNTWTYHRQARTTR